MVRSEELGCTAKGFGNAARFNGSSRFDSNKTCFWDGLAVQNAIDSSMLLSLLSIR